MPRLMRPAATLALVASVAALPVPASAAAETGVIRDANGCRFTNPSPKPNEQITWSGGCRDGWGDGFGELRWLVDGVPTYIYTGTVAAGKLEGDGAENIRGDRFVGHFADGRRQGHGVFTWHDGLRYDGDFAHGQMEGHGVLQLPDGARFDGRFVNNILQSPVTMAKAKGDTSLRLTVEMPGDAAPAQAPASAASAAGTGARIKPDPFCAPTYPRVAVAQGAKGATKFSLQIAPSSELTRVRLDQRSGTDFAHQLLDLFALSALMDCARQGGAPGSAPQWTSITYVWKLE